MHKIAFFTYVHRRTNQSESATKNHQIRSKRETDELRARLSSPIFEIELPALYVMRFRKPRLRVKSVNFDFSAKLSSTEYNEWNTPNPKFLAHIRSEKSLVELEVQRMSFFPLFHFSLYRKVYLFTLSHS